MKSSRIATSCDSLALHIVLLISFFVLLQIPGWARLPNLANFITVDTLSETNWTQIANPNLSITRVQASGLLHRKIWILPFDEAWQLGLRLQNSTTQCAARYAPIETHVASGASIATAAKHIATYVKRNRRVAPLIPLGRPFLLEYGMDREIVYVFAMLVEGLFPIKSTESFEELVRPVQFVRMVESLTNDSERVIVTDGQYNGCSQEKARWLAKAVSYAVRRFQLKGLLTKANLLESMQTKDPICCRESVETTENLNDCGLPCNGTGLYNILSYLPKA